MFESERLFVILTPATTGPVKPRSSGKFSKHSDWPLKLPEAARLKRAEFLFLTRSVEPTADSTFGSDATLPVQFHFAL